MASDKYFKYPQLSVSALHAGSVSFAMSGKWGKSQVFSLLSEPHVQMRSPFTALPSCTVTGEHGRNVCETQPDLCGLLKNEI